MDYAEPQLYSEGGSKEPIGGEEKFSQQVELITVHLLITLYGRVSGWDMDIFGL